MIARRILYVSSLGVGYCIYRKLLFLTTIKNNIILDADLTSQLHK